MTFQMDTTQIDLETLDTNIPTHRSFHSLNITHQDVFLECMFNIMVIMLSQIKYLLFRIINILFFFHLALTKKKNPKMIAPPNIFLVK